LKINFENMLTYPAADEDLEQAIDSIGCLLT
jgi:hypothetical protein